MALEDYMLDTYLATSHGLSANTVYPTSWSGGHSSGYEIVKYNGYGQPEFNQFFEDDAEGRDALAKVMEQIQNDIRKRKEENAKRLTLRLTDVSVDGMHLFREGKDVTEEVVKELKTGIKRAVWAFSETVDILTQREPTIFDGWELVVADEESDIDMTDLPKEIEQKDETSDDFIARVKRMTDEKHAKEDEDLTRLSNVL